MWELRPFSAGSASSLEKVEEAPTVEEKDDAMEPLKRNACHAKAMPCDARRINQMLAKSEAWQLRPPERRAAEVRKGSTSFGDPRQRSHRPQRPPLRRKRRSSGGEERHSNKLTCN